MDDDLFPPPSTQMPTPLAAWFYCQERVGPDRVLNADPTRSAQIRDYWTNHPLIGQVRGEIPKFEDLVSLLPRI